jgi:hypothetical protein
MLKNQWRQKMTFEESVSCLADALKQSQDKLVADYNRDVLKLCEKELPVGTAVHWMCCDGTSEDGVVVGYSTNATVIARMFDGLTEELNVDQIVKNS